MNTIVRERKGGGFAGLILIVIGLAFLADSLDWVHFPVWEVVWPAIIILIGLRLLFRRKSPVVITYQTSSSFTSNAPSGTPPPPPPPPPPPKPVGATMGDKRGESAADYVAESHVFGELDLSVTSTSFRGGTASTVFGEIRLDLSRAMLAEGEQQLSINTVFGAVRVYVPRGWEYMVEANTVFGEVEVNGVKRGGIFSNVTTSTPNYATATTKLRISSSTVFGEVKVIES